MLKGVLLCNSKGGAVWSSTGIFIYILTGEQNCAREVKFAPNTRLKQPAGLRAFSKTYPQFKQIVVTQELFDINEELIFLPGCMV